MISNTPSSNPPPSSSSATPQPVTITKNTPHTQYIYGEKLVVTPLGAGNEVGRSAVLLQFKGKTVLFDCGIHPAFTGMASLPFFDTIEPSEIDLVLVTHFHLDHCGALPYFTEHTNFQGRVFMTHPTKAIYKLLLTDFVKVSDVHVDDQLFTEQNLLDSLKKIELIDYHQELEHNGIKFWCYNAGHVLGAAMFMVEIAGVRVLYTGDFSRQPDRHLLGAETPTMSPDVLIVESTYGIQVHESQSEREKRFTQMVTEIVKRGGRCLIPVFALGRAQELLLILDEFWETHQDLQHIPIYYASSLAKKCMTIFQTYINMMNDKIRKQFDIHNPFVFKHISNLRSIEDFQDNGPCVIMASPGMLQSGLSKELFELWCQDAKNGVIIAGYSVDGTLAKKIMSEPETVTLSNGNTVPLRMSVRTISFSAHSDKAQTEEFIGTIKPPHIILVHGDLANCNRLKHSLQSKFTDSKVYAPKNCTSINIMFQGEKRAKVLGQLAVTKYEDGDEINGILLHHNFQHLLLNEKDLKLYSDVCCSGVKQTLLVPLNDTVPYEQLIRSVFSNVTLETEPTEVQVKSEIMDTTDDKKEDIKYTPIEFAAEAAKPIVIFIDGVVRIELRLQEKTPCGVIEWPSSAANDTIVDSICNLILYTDKSFHESLLDEGKDELKMLYCIQQMLKEHFGECTCRLSENREIDVVDKEDKVIVKVSSMGEIIECVEERNRGFLEIVIRRIFMSMFPLPTMMGCLDDCDHGHSHH
ncbi:predicted protein [Naegleria gruberi]|uniref:Predicted protein n=1 Tax=Naegleria gruberi TaxID=5762 RepID=D2VUV7_NAEGR|nr:uncharacterized protein NAEGRDRAFT_72801 [Naegleria gruberi]EFC39387.1 predicted protein [Naegleria gruberi]|eukprot:XP_002672131.1 predicted protein [Naegleria gruberi strain NEG-M]